MMLFGQTNVQKPCEQYMFEGQATLQKICVYAALVCIPILLFGKPLHFMCTKKSKKGKIYVSIVNTPAHSFFIPPR